VGWSGGVHTVGHFNKQAPYSVNNYVYRHLNGCLSNNELKQLHAIHCIQFNIPRTGIFKWSNWNPFRHIHISINSENLYSATIFKVMVHIELLDGRLYVTPKLPRLVRYWEMKTFPRILWNEVISQCYTCNLSKELHKLMLPFIEQLLYQSHQKLVIQLHFDFPTNHMTQCFPTPCQSAFRTWPYIITHVYTVHFWVIWQAQPIYTTCQISLLTKHMNHIGAKNNQGMQVHSWPWCQLCLHRNHMVTSSVVGIRSRSIDRRQYHYDPYRCEKQSS